MAFVGTTDGLTESDDFAEFGEHRSIVRDSTEKSKGISMIIREVPARMTLSHFDEATIIELDEVSIFTKSQLREIADSYDI